MTAPRVYVVYPDPTDESDDSRMAFGSRPEAEAYRRSLGCAAASEVYTEDASC